MSAKPQASFTSNACRLKFAISGGGPIGCLAACILAQDGHEVTVFEKRADPRGSVANGARSINLSLSTRGMDALAAIGLDQAIVRDHSVPVNGRMIHKRNGECEAMFYGLEKELVTHSVNRQLLNDTLLQATEKYENITMNFSSRVMSSDLESGILDVQHAWSNNNAIRCGPFDVILGCDGVHSMVRSEMLRKGTFNFSQQSIPHGYVELIIPPTSNKQFAMPSNFVHIWPRKDFLMIALPNRDCSYTVSLFMPFSTFQEINVSADSALDFFRHHFPDALQLIGEEDFVGKFLPLKPSSLIMTQCKPYNWKRAVLLGDAAHAVVPFYAQGINAGMEDCLIFRDFLRQELESTTSVVDVPLVLKRYSDFRSPDGHAISHLSLYNYNELRSLVLTRKFQLRKRLDYAVHKILGSKWDLTYNAVTFSRKRYSECLQIKKDQDKVIFGMTLIAFVIVFGAALVQMAGSPF